MRKRISKGLSKIIGNQLENRLIPDPWQESKVEPSPQVINTSSESPSKPLELPLITPATATSTSELSPAQILLQDELKLRISQAEKLGEHIKDALALLYWLPSVPA